MVVNPAEGEGEEGEVALSIVQPKKQKTPVGVRAEGTPDAEPDAEAVAPPAEPPAADG